jgi:hypothetical protein
LYIGPPSVKIVDISSYDDDQLIEKTWCVNRTAPQGGIVPPDIDVPDPLTPAQRKQHAARVADLWQAYGRGENSRVPIAFASDDQLWIKVAGCTFGQFYLQPKCHLRAQLEGRKWFTEHVIADMSPLPPEIWTVGVQLWMEENEFFGCKVIYQEDNYAWGMPLEMDKACLLAYLADLDPEQRVLSSSAYRMYNELKALTSGIEYEGRKVQVAAPGQGTHGIFTKAAEVRGLEQLCLDLNEDPDFAHTYLQLFTTKEIARIQAWRKLTQPDAPDLPLKTSWSCPDDSLQLLSPALYKEFVLPCHELLFTSMTTDGRGMHLCGYSSQHFETLNRKLGIKSIDGPGVFVDHGYYLRTFAPDFSFNAQTEHGVVTNGSPSEIETMIQGLLTTGAKVAGRFNIVGFVERDTPLANVDICYQAGIRAGQIKGE